MNSPAERGRANSNHELNSINSTVTSPYEICVSNSFLHIFISIQIPNVASMIHSISLQPCIAIQHRIMASGGVGGALCLYKVGDPHAPGQGPAFRKNSRGVVLCASCTMAVDLETSCTTLIGLRASMSCVTTVRTASMFLLPRHHSLIKTGATLNSATVKMEKFRHRQVRHGFLQ